MSSLVIEYQLDTKRPGYAFRQPTNGYSDALLKAVWRQAMPRGQGWGAETYQGARAVKCFPLGGGVVAFSEMVVTDQADEQGRRGIRRVEIDLLSEPDVIPALRTRLEAYPDRLRAIAQSSLNLPRWMQIIDQALPRLSGRASQVILAHPYTGPDAWQLVEVIVLQLATAWLLRALPGWGNLFSFTTLALTHEGESRLLAVPLEKARQMQDARVILIS